MSVGKPSPSPDPGDDLPSWLVFEGDNPLIRSVLAEMWANPVFREYLTEAYAPEGQASFLTYVGGRGFLDRFNATRPRREQVKMRPEAAGISIFTPEPDSTATNAGIVIDVDRIHDATRARRGAPVDSAQAREFIRDAVIHELAHVTPVARSQHMRDMLGDPKPGDRNAHRHPVIQKENKLRGLLDLPAKDFYGLLR